MTIPSSLRKVANDYIGGNITSILNSQALRLKALTAGINYLTGLGTLPFYRYQSPLPTIAGIAVTTRQQETYTYDSDVTEHAVESGAILTDHVILRPIKIDLSFEVTNWKDGDAQNALELLEAMRNLRLPVELQTEHKTIKEMILTNLQADNTAETWGALRFRATFKQVKLITLETVPYPEEKTKQTDKTGGPDTSKSAETGTNRGLQTPSDVSAGLGLFRKTGIFTQ